MTPHASAQQQTSLNFISRPNPVEPNAIAHQPDLASGRQSENLANDDLLRVLRDPRFTQASREAGISLSINQSTASIGQGSSSNSVATLLNPERGSDGSPHQHSPREIDLSQYVLPLPTQQGVKRQRAQVPPVLQGLHQPPPNAGLLPSMNAEKSDVSRPALHDSDVSPTQTVNDDIRSPVPRLVVKVHADQSPRPARRNKWTDEETHYLLQGTRRFGVGNWKKILLCPDFSFNHRTATDLKDRFRVVSSNKEMLIHYQIYASYRENPPDQTGEGHRAAAVEASQQRHDSTGSIEADLSLPRAKRRQRTKWSEEEDDALLRGFGKYGPSWTSIQLDPILAKRTPTDIRDRIRTRFSEDYAKAGLAPKPSKPRTQMRSQPKPPPPEEDANNLNDKSSGPILPKLVTNTAREEGNDSTHPKTAPPTGLPPQKRPAHQPYSAVAPDTGWFSDYPLSTIPAHYATKDSDKSAAPGAWYNSNNPSTARD